MRAFDTHAATPNEWFTRALYMLIFDDALNVLNVVSCMYAMLTPENPVSHRVNVSNSYLVASEKEHTGVWQVMPKSWEASMRVNKNPKTH